MMVAETPNDPARVPPARLATLEQSDFFVCDIADAALKDLIPSLEHPFWPCTHEGVQNGKTSMRVSLSA